MIRVLDLAWWEMVHLAERGSWRVKRGGARELQGGCAECEGRALAVLEEWERGSGPKVKD